MTNAPTPGDLPEPAAPHPTLPTFTGNPIEGYAAEPAPAAPLPPARRTRWSARRTAVTAGLAIVVTSAAAIGASALLSSGSPGDDGGSVPSRIFSPGGRDNGHGGVPNLGPGQQQGPQQGQLPRQLPGPAGQLPNDDDDLDT